MKEKLEALLKQYELIQNYTFNTIPASKNSILSFGLTILGAIFTGNIVLLSTEKYLEVSNFIFVFILPLASTTILFIWLGEIQRMMRAGFFLLSLEQQINKLVDDTIFTWEIYIRKKENKIKYPDIFALCIFLGTSFFSIIASLIISDTSVLGIPKLIILIYDVLCHIILIVFIFRKARKFK